MPPNSARPASAPVSTRIARTTPSTVADGMLVASMQPAAALVLVDDRGGGRGFVDTKRHLTVG